MNEKTIRKLIHLVEESDIESLEIRRWFRTVKIIKRHANNHNGASSTASAKLVDIPLPVAATPPAPGAVAAPAPVETPSAPPATNLIEIKAPMVGTFYRAPSPGAPPFVKPDQSIAPGDVLCIIEAMKLMNEIDAEQGGKIVKVLVEDAHPVEFGQPLFLLDPAG
ncbi:MAG: acetyl-CoA carboxylase biotin carboxyl carrier protein [candidate division Zixibacteria bacterium]|nr:acetyl-CoA carboxylase biotin carboxyl carrier protein [candidate division Zixibacteria bacterium]